jgi:hypothetical protein
MWGQGFRLATMAIRATKIYDVLASGCVGVTERDAEGQFVLEIPTSEIRPPYRLG